MDIASIKAPPIFLSANYFNRHTDLGGGLAVSSGATLRHRLYDMDPAAQWSSAESDDTTLETIDLGLWLPGMQTVQTIDLVALLNHNFREVTVERSADNGENYNGLVILDDELPADAVTLGTGNLLINAASVNADRVRIQALRATGGGDKLLGAIVVGELLFQPSVGMSLFTRQPFRVKAKTARMHDGSTRRTFVGRSDASVHFNDFSVGISGLDEDDADTLQGILLSRSPFIFFPEPGNRRGNMYLGQAVPGTVTRNYLSKSRSGGEAITFEFEEAGGA
jgi:hypothetical protein